MLRSSSCQPPGPHTAATATVSSRRMEKTWLMYRYSENLVLQCLCKQLHQRGWKFKHQTLNQYNHVPLENSSSQSKLMNKQLFFARKRAEVKLQKGSASLEQKTYVKIPEV